MSLDLRPGNQGQTTFYFRLWAKCNPVLPVAGMAADAVGLQKNVVCP